MVERYVRDVEVVGSNPVTSTMKKARFCVLFSVVFALRRRRLPNSLPKLNVKLYFNEGYVIAIVELA